MTETPKEVFAYTVLSGKDLLELPPPEWRVKGVFPKTGLAALYGPSRVGKSFLALDLALAVAQGENWFDRKTKPCPVLYVCLEAFGGLPNRFKAWIQENGKPCPENLYFINESLDLKKPEQVRAIINAASDHNCKMVIIDTLNRAAPNIEENQSKDMSIIISAAATVQQGIAGLVIFVAHTGKDASKEIRGHSSLIAALDAAVKVDEAGFLELYKVKEGEDGKKIYFGLKPVVAGTDLDGEPVTSCVVVPHGIQQREEKSLFLTGGRRYALESFKAACEATGTESLHAEIWRGYFYANHSGENTEAKKKAFQRARGDLVKSGILSEENDVYTMKNTGQ